MKSQTNLPSCFVPIKRSVSVKVTDEVWEPQKKGLSNFAQALNGSESEFYAFADLISFCSRDLVREAALR